MTDLLTASRSRIEVLAKILNGRHQAEHDDLLQEGFFAAVEYETTRGRNDSGGWPYIASRMQGWVSFCAQSA